MKQVDARIDDGQCPLGATGCAGGFFYSPYISVFTEITENKRHNREAMT